MITANYQLPFRSHRINNRKSTYFYEVRLQIFYRFIIAICCLFFVVKSNAQNGHGIYDTIRVDACVESNGDTIPCSLLPYVFVYGKETAKGKRNRLEWTRLRNAVYVTFPYALKASQVMNDINAKLVGVTDRSERKKIIRSREKDLKKEFADKLTQLSVYQGKVLMKLINRQTGNNCYEIIQEYKGGFTAGFWQTVAVVVGSNLKQPYDPQGADRAMESIVQDVEKMYGIRRQAMVN
ncbi:MAG: DUF4294 domain-containing protein [Williamsia sp.]|nr:DUF4294 domain-containing protein [Williamsia sp.]